MLPILDVDAAADRLDQIDDLQEMAKNLQQMGHGMSGESFMGLSLSLWRRSATVSTSRS
jgi:hypothetical protein